MLHKCYTCDTAALEAASGDFRIDGRKLLSVYAYVYDEDWERERRQGQGDRVRWEAYRALAEASHCTGFQVGQ
jgi:hypothetical protein